MTGTESAKEASDVQPAARVPPFGVIAAALAFGVLLVGGVTMGGYISTLSPRGQSQGDSNAQSPSAPQEQTRPPPSVDATPAEWQTKLQSTSCSSPCVGGVACAEKPTRCTSGFTCVPGAVNDLIVSSEPWMFHLSAVIETDATGIDLDPCATKREYSVCRVGTLECLSQRAACGKTDGAMSPTGIAMVSGELLGPAGAFEVREGSPSGPVVANTRAFPRYSRGALCRGFGIGTDSPRFKKLTFFLLPP